jgi:hypothetical protein
MKNRNTILIDPLLTSHIFLTNVKLLNECDNSLYKDTIFAEPVKDGLILTFLRRNPWSGIT